MGSCVGRSAADKIRPLLELTPSSVGRQAAPLAATQDTSGEERQDPCPVLQPLAQPASHLQLWPATADPLWRGRLGDTGEENLGEGAGWGVG